MRAWPGLLDARIDGDYRPAEGDRAVAILASMADAPTPASVEEVKEALARVDYLADEPAALVSFLAQRLAKPVLVEGPAGVGKTELAKALSRASSGP